MEKLVKNIHLWIALIAIVIVFLGYCVFKHSFSTRIMPKRQFMVEVGKVTNKKMQTVLEFIGTAISNESVDITSCITQKVEKINFSDCDLVKKGDVLVQLNVERQKAIQKQAEINLLEQERELTRLSTLKNKKIVAEKEYDAQNTKLQNAQAKLDEIKEEIKEGTIIAPFDGILGIRKISVGSLLTPTTVITTIDDIKKIKVDFPVPEKYWSSVNKNCKITATSIAVPDREFYGTVQAISPRISPMSRSISVRGIIDNDKYLLRPGMMLNVTIQMQDRDAIMVPESAIFNIGEKHFVFLLLEGNKVKQTQIEIGQRQKNLVEVVGGLKKDDTIVTDGIVKISDGDVVTISQKQAGDL